MEGAGSQVGLPYTTRCPPPPIVPTQGAAYTLTRPAPLGRLPSPRRHGSRAPCRGSSPRPPSCPRGAGLVLRSGACRQRGRGRDHGCRAWGRGGGGWRRLRVRAGAAATHQAGGRGGEQSHFRFRSRYAHTPEWRQALHARPSHAMTALPPRRSSASCPCARWMTQARAGDEILKNRPGRRRFLECGGLFSLSGTHSD